jgi:hypothetical protein
LFDALRPLFGVFMFIIDIL